MISFEFPHYNSLMKMYFRVWRLLNYGYQKFIFSEKYLCQYNNSSLHVNGHGNRVHFSLFSGPVSPEQ